MGTELKKRSSLLYFAYGNGLAELQNGGLLLAAR
jgi:hypothetical protein